MAKPFTFKLQKVLEYREQLEDQARLALAQAQVRYQEHNAHLDELRRLYDEHSRSLSGRKELTENEIWLFLKYKERLLLDIQKGEEMLQILARRVAEARRELVIRSKDRKLLEKLKTKQAKRHVEAQNLHEQKQVDELAAIRFEHKNF